MNWLTNLIVPQTGGASVAHDVLMLAFVVASGLALGSIRIRRVGIGVAGVLFAGIACSQLGLSIATETLEFVREFGLVLFVYTIGLQVGPGFVGSLRRRGLRFNLLAASVVLLGIFTTLGIYFFTDVGMPVAVGLMSGATTNTPSFAAAQQALVGGAATSRPLIGVGYAIAYPFGVIGLISVVSLLRLVFRIDLNKERELLLQSEEAKPRVAIKSFEVQNKNLNGVRIESLPMLEQEGIVISRVQGLDGKVRMAQDDTELAVGQVILAVGTEAKLEQFRILVGAYAKTDLMQAPSDIDTRRLIVTGTRALGKTVDELELRERYGVTITRVTRADIDLPVSPALKLQFADTVAAVGATEAIDKAARVLGNSSKELNHPMLVPVFVGIALGVLVGSWPIGIPGVPVPVKLGLAGGPLLVAILLSRAGNIGPLVWYMPASASFMLREVGISLFLACVGLRAGERFFETLLSANGLKWLMLAALITVVPPLVMGLVARLVFRLNFLTIAGLLAGSMTDPPALAFVNASTGSESPAIAYATVYPFTMILRVLAAQLLVVYAVSF